MVEDGAVEEDAADDGLGEAREVEGGVVDVGVVAGRARDVAAAGVVFAVAVLESADAAGRAAIDATEADAAVVMSASEPNTSSTPPPSVVRAWGAWLAVVAAGGEAAWPATVAGDAAVSAKPGRVKSAPPPPVRAGLIVGASPPFAAGNVGGAAGAGWASTPISDASALVNPSTLALGPGAAAPSAAGGANAVDSRAEAATMAR